MNQKGTLEIIDYGGEEGKNQRFNKALKFMSGSMDVHQYVWLSIAEYVITSLSLSLIIAKFFPAVHNQVVSRATRLEHQSLYWGTVIVSNVFTYGLLFMAERGMSMFLLMSYLWDMGLEWHTSILLIQEGLFNSILFIGALVASLRGQGSTGVPIPSGMAKVMIYISFFFSFVCCCVDCSPECKTKTFKVLINFSFMSFIYHSIMDAISVSFLLFIAGYRALIITFTLLYISLLIFLVLFSSFSLLTLSRDRDSEALVRHQCLYCCGGSFMFFTSFGAVVLMIVMYMVIMFSLNLQGVGGIVTGLIPSIGLSAASWYIKKWLDKELSQSNTSQTEQGTTAGPLNDGETEDGTDDHTLLMP